LEILNLSLRTVLNLQDVNTNPEWESSLQLSSSPMVELEVPGIIFTIPRSTIDYLDPDMDQLAYQWKTIMEAFFDLSGYVMPIPQRYVTDVEITAGSEHSGYPVMDAPLETYLFDMSGNPGTLTSGEAWGCFHEIGHNVQDSRWTPSLLTECTVNIFSAYVKLQGVQQ
jgi:hypothetical protein